MSNPIHIVIKLMPQEVKTWTDNEVLERWTHLYTGLLVLQLQDDLGSEHLGDTRDVEAITTVRPALPRKSIWLSPDWTASKTAQVLLLAVSLSINLCKS
jgi:hypothetical protein